MGVEIGVISETGVSFALDKMFSQNATDSILEYQDFSYPAFCRAAIHQYAASSRCCEAPSGWRYRSGVSDLFAAL
jgi:hypothetical protein